MLHNTACITHLYPYQPSPHNLELYSKQDHDDVIKWKHFSRYWPFVRGIHRSLVNSPLPVTRSFDVFFDLRLNKRLSKQSWGWWFETQSLSLWRHCNATDNVCVRSIARWHTILSIFCTLSSTLIPRVCTLWPFEVIPNCKQSWNIDAASDVTWVGKLNWGWQWSRCTSIHKSVSNLTDSKNILKGTCQFVRHKIQKHYNPCQITQETLQDKISFDSFHEIKNQNTA